MNNDSPLSQNNDNAGIQMSIAVVVISVLLTVGKAVGYIKEILLAYYFGLSRSTDAFKAVYNGLLMLIYTKVEKLLRPTYLPEFVKTKNDQSESDAWRITSVLSSVQFLFLLAIAAGGIIFAQPLVRLLWHGQQLTTDEIRLTVMLIRIMAPALVLFSLSVMPELTLHAHKRFTLPAIAEVCFKTAIPLMMVALIGVIWAPDDPRAIYAAAIGVLLGGAARLFVQIGGLRRALRHFRPSLAIFTTPGVGHIFALMPPVVLGLIFSTFRVLNDVYVPLQMGEGILSALDFGRKLNDLAILILPLAVSFVVYPYLSEWAVRGEKDRLADALVGMTRAMAFIFIPLSVAMVLLAHPLCSLVYEVGETGPEGIALISLALRCYALGIFFYAVEGSINKWYFALKDTATPNYVGATMAVVHILIAYGGGLLLGWGLGAVALALTISKSAKVIILYGLLRGRIGKVDPRRVYPFVLKLLLCTMVMGIIVHLVGRQVGPAVATWQPPIGGAKVRVAALFGVTGLAGIAVFLTMAALTRIEELFTVGNYLIEKIRGRFAISD